MTTSQYTNLMSAFRRVESKVDQLEERMAFEFPTEHEAREQIEAELADILATGGVRVFADD
jgi:hypothetical protein